jgi:predicted porin
VDEGDDVVDVDRTGMREPIHTVASSYQHVFGRTAAAEFTGGVVKAEAGNSFVFVVSADKRFGEMAVGGAFSRTLMFYAGDRRFLAPGLRSNDIYEVATFRLRGWLKPKVAMDLNVAASRDASPVFIKRTKSLMGRFRVDYRFHDRTSLFLSLETYRQNRNEFVGAPLARNRVFVGLQYSINEDQYRRITDFAMEPEYIGLPGRGRRR